MCVVVKGLRRCPVCDLAKNVGIEKKGPLYIIVCTARRAFFFFKYYYLTDLLRLIECKISRKRWPPVNNTTYVFNTAYNVVAHPHSPSDATEPTTRSRVRARTGAACRACAANGHGDNRSHGPGEKTREKSIQIRDTFIVRV